MPQGKPDFTTSLKEKIALRRTHTRQNCAAGQLEKRTWPETHQEPQECFNPFPGIRVPAKGLLALVGRHKARGGQVLYESELHDGKRSHAAQSYPNLTVGNCN